MLPVMVAHRPVGVTRLVTEVATDNPASLAMLRRLGRVSAEVAGPGIYHVQVVLDVPAGGAAGGPPTPSQPAPGVGGRGG